MAEFPPSVGIRDLIAAHTATSGWQVDISVMPDSPDKAIMIADTGGLDPNPKWLLDFPSAQIVIRGAANGYLATYREAKALKDILLGIDSQDLNGDRWVAINMSGDIIYLGRDEDMRPTFSMNFALIIEPQVVAGTNRTAL